MLFHGEWFLDFIDEQMTDPQIDNLFDEFLKLDLEMQEEGANGRPEKRTQDKRGKAAAFE
jgi:hypothetical protein